MRRTGPVLALAAAAVAAAALAPVPAVAATAAPVVQLRLADPLMTDPVEVLVAVTDAGGDALPFTGVVTLTTGRTSVSASTTADAAGVAEVDLPTGALSGGSATVHAVVRAGGGTAVVTIPRFADVPVGLAVGGFGCAALTAAGGQVRFAVTTMNGAPVPHPATVAWYELPYVLVPDGPTRMVDSDGLPLATSGRMTIRSGARTVATVALPKAVRPLVFGVRWAARVGGRFVPGAYTATLALTDAHGRTTTAVRAVRLVTSAAGACA